VWRVVSIFVLDEITDVFQQVQERSGIPVEVTTDPSMPTFASIKTARGSMIAHVLTYNPGKPGVDYHLAYQCGFVLRLYENPPEERFEFGGRESGREAVRSLIAKKGGIAKRLKLSEAAVEQMTDQFFDGLLTQLRSYPIGMRVDQWIRETYPNLHDAQEASIARQQQENVRSLGPQIKQMTPPIIFSGNASMNAAYALFCERLLSASQYFIPYRSAGFKKPGRTLLALWDEVPADARHDRELVDAWGKELDVSDWYQWVPLERVQ